MLIIIILFCNYKICLFQRQIELRAPVWLQSCWFVKYGKDRCFSIKSRTIGTWRVPKIPIFRRDSR